MEQGLAWGEQRIEGVFKQFDDAAIGKVSTGELLEHIERISDPTQELSAQDRGEKDDLLADADPFADEPDE
jgi:Ca2+-binding EF-hand superfamily protein